MVTRCSQGIGPRVDTLGDTKIFPDDHPSSRVQIPYVITPLPRCGLCSSMQPRLLQSILMKIQLSRNLFWTTLNSEYYFTVAFFHRFRYFPVLVNSTCCRVRCITRNTCVPVQYSGSNSSTWCARAADRTEKQRLASFTMSKELALGLEND